MFRIITKRNSGSFLTTIFNCRLCNTNTQFSKIEDTSKCQPHIPVLLNEVISNLNPKINQIFLDMTFGAGGHTKKILETAPNAIVYALDRDPVAYEYAVELQKVYPKQIIPLLGRFSELPQLLREKAIPQNYFDGIFFDFGCSSMQFDEAERGFAISKNGPLDMRMDKDRFPDQPTAADILAKIDENDLARIIKIYGEERNAKKIARAIIETRYTFKKLQTTKELTDLVNACTSDEMYLDKLQRVTNVATKTFQAIRIFVNNELNEINYGLIVAQKYLKIGGHLVTITFHSLEDKIVKRHLMGNITDNVVNPMPLKYMNPTVLYEKEAVEVMMNSGWQQLHKHVITPSLEEIELNPRSRSAKLRAAVKIS